MPIPRAKPHPRVDFQPFYPPRPPPDAHFACQERPHFIEQKANIESPTMPQTTAKTPLPCPLFPFQPAPHPAADENRTLTFENGDAKPARCELSEQPPSPSPARGPSAPPVRSASPPPLANGTRDPAHNHFGARRQYSQCRRRRCRSRPNMGTYGPNER